METKQNILSYLKMTHGSDIVGAIFNFIQDVAEKCLSKRSFNRYLDKSSAEDKLSEDSDCWIINGILYDWRVFESKKWEMVSDFLERFTSDDLKLIASELACMSKTHVPFTIMQLKKSGMEKYGFASFDFASKHGFSLKDYKEIWKGTYDNSKQNFEDKQVLEQIFIAFNRVNESDSVRLEKLKFFGHSLSTSDVVVLNGKPYYCDSFGWKEIAR